MTVGQVGERGDVKEGQARIAGHFAEEETRVGVDLGGPFGHVERVAHPTYIHAALDRVALAEEHKGAAIALGADDDIGARIAATGLYAGMGWLP